MPPKSIPSLAGKAPAKPVAAKKKSKRKEAYAKILAKKKSHVTDREGNDVSSPDKLSLAGPAKKVKKN